MTVQQLKDYRHNNDLEIIYFVQKTEILCILKMMQFCYNLCLVWRWGNSGGCYFPRKETRVCWTSMKLGKHKVFAEVTKFKFISPSKIEIQKRRVRQKKWKTDHKAS